MQANFNWYIFLLFVHGQILREFESLYSHRSMIITFFLFILKLCIVDKLLYMFKKSYH